MGLAQQCCPGLDLKAELERSFLSEPSSPGHTKTPKGFRLGKHKHETFITRYRSRSSSPPHHCIGFQRLSCHLFDIFCLINLIKLSQT